MFLQGAAQFCGELLPQCTENQLVVLLHRVGLHYPQYSCCSCCTPETERRGELVHRVLHSAEEESCCLVVHCTAVHREPVS